MAYTEEELLDELKKLAEEVEETPTTTQMDKIGKFSSGTYQYRFGTWNEALNQIGLDINREKRDDPCLLSKEDVIKEIKEISENYCENGIPTWRQAIKYCQHHPETYTNKFNCDWNDLTFEALDSYNKAGRDKGGSNYSKNELISEIKRLSKEYHNGKTPCIGTLIDKGSYSPRPYKTHFGSWNEALEECGFEPNVKTFDTDNPKRELLNEIKRVSKEELNDERPTRCDMIEYSNIPIMFWHYFGSWNNAVEEAGFERYDIDATGEDHWLWKGGYPSHYGSSWHHRRREVKQRDGDVCRVCDKHEQETKGSLEVHHITPARYWDTENRHKQMNHPRNLISLCISCHRELDGMFKGRNHVEFEELAREYMDDQGKGVFDY